MVYFCPFCANMLLIEYGLEGAMRFYCQTCPYVCLIPRKLTKTFQLKRKTVDDVLGDDAWVNADTDKGMSIDRSIGLDVYANNLTLHCCCYNPSPSYVS
jgi:DNA-directed RNA polymerase subunit M/transcription elongation factor TFIIS